MRRILPARHTSNTFHGINDELRSKATSSSACRRCCFTIAEMIEYEAMGLAPRGQGWRVIREGTTRMDGALPVNPSGGLKSRGHPIGATGVSQHVMAAMQLTGDAGAMQVPGAELAGVFNMGGTAVANYCSILEREK